MSSAAAFAFQAKYGDRMADKYIVFKQIDISFIFSMTDQGVFGTAAGTWIFPKSKEGRYIFYIIIDINVKINYHKIIVSLWKIHKRFWIWRRFIFGGIGASPFLYFTIKKVQDKRIRKKNPELLSPLSIQ